MIRHQLCTTLFGTIWHPTNRYVPSQPLRILSIPKIKKSTKTDTDSMTYTWIKLIWQILLKESLFVKGLKKPWLRRSIGEKQCMIFVMPGEKLCQLIEGIPMATNNPRLDIRESVVRPVEVQNYHTLVVRILSPVVVLWHCGHRTLLTLPYH